jgi:hypothetical protein
MHDRILTASNMMRQNWPCNPLCSLCFCMTETTEHLLTQCNYVEVVWNLVAPQVGFRSYNQMLSLGGPVSWVTFLAKHGSKEDQKRNLGVLFLFWWLIWK